MKSIKKFLASLAVGILLISTGFLAYGQSSVIIGTGTLSYSSALYPIYRSSAASSFDYAMGWGLYTATDLSSIPIGATIVKIAWDKTDANSTVGNAKFDIYLKNSSLTTLPSATWAVATTGATLVYSTTAQSIPGVAGWVEFPITPFTYNGGGLEVLTNWDISAVSGNPTTGSFGWRYSTASGTVRGSNSSTALSGATSLSSTTSNRANIQIWYLPPPPNDAGITAVTGPVAPAVPGPNNIIVTLTNMGSNALTSAGIRYKLNGVTSALIPWVGSIAPGTSATGIDLGSGNFVTGMNDLVVWSVSPNGTTDPRNSNDTTKTSILACNPLSGTYTVGAGGNFTTLHDVLYALNMCGVDGPVIFNFTPSATPFIGGVEFGAITGVSATNTITLNGNGSVINEGTPSFILGFNGASYITVNNFQIVNSNPAVDKFGILMRGASQYLSFTNNTIDMGQATTTTATAGIVASNSLTSATTAGNNAQNITITGNQIIGGYYGISLYGQASYLNAFGYTITNNTIRDFYIYAINLNNVENTTVAGNNIHRANRTTISSFYGVYMTTCRNMKVKQNQLHTSGSGSYIAYPIYLSTSVNVAGSETDIVNNAIYNIPTTGTVYGIYLLGTRDYVNIYHNTVHLIAEGTSAKRAIWMSTAPTNHNMVNNLLSIQGTGTGTKYLVYITTTAASFVSNYNNLYIASGGTANHTGYWTADRTTLTDWQTASSLDANSVAIEPVFPSATNFTPVKFQLDNKGTPIVGINTDIFNNLRSLTTPDVGAVEFVAPTNPIMVLSATNYDFGLVEAGKTYSFTLTISNAGPSPLLILNKTVASPFSIVTTPPTGFITVLPNASTTATVRYTPTGPGIHNATLQFTANTTVINLSVQLSGQAYAPGSLLEDFEGPAFPPVGWTLVQGPCSPTNDIIKSSSQSVSPSNSLRFSSDLSCSGGYSQYAITPRLVTDATSRTFSFWYRRSTTSYTERFRVGWSSTGNNVATDFTWSDTTIIPAVLQWYKFEKTDLPIGTRYVVIHYFGDYAQYVYVDDVFGPPLYVFPHALTTQKLDVNQTVLGGQSFNYRVAVKNTGANADVYNLSTTSSKAFTYTIRNKQDNATISTLPLAPGVQDTIILKVTVTAAGTNTGDISNAVLKLISQADPSVQDSVAFTTTAFIPFTPFYIQQFTTYTGTSPYQFWTEAKGAIGNPTTFTSTTASNWSNDDFANVVGHPNGQSARMNIWSTGNFEWLLSPLFDLGAKSAYKLEFDLALTPFTGSASTTLNNDDTLALVISTDGGTTWNHSNIIRVWDPTTPISNTGDHIVVDLTPYSGLVKFGFYAKSNVSGGDVNVYIDNFALIDPNSIPECMTGAIPADSAIDQSPTIQLSWGNQVNTLGYKLYLGTTNPPPFVANLGNVTTYNPVGLAYNTTYYWKVVPYNAGGDAVGCPVWTFKTLTPYNIPYVQDFATTGLNPPLRWSEAQGVIANPTVFTATTSNWTGDEFGNVIGHPNGTAAYLNIWSSDKYDWLISPHIDLGSGSQVFIEFDLALTDYATTASATMDGNDTLALVISTDGGATWHKDNIIALWDTNNPIPAAGTLVQLSLNNPMPKAGNVVKSPLTTYSGVVQFGFYGQSRLSGADIDIFVDNFKVLAPGILGYVNYANSANTPLDSVSVNIPAQSKTTQTNAAGIFSFMPMASGTYNLTASSNQPVGGVNSTDALLAIRHFVGLNTLTGMPALAADVTGAGGINAADALEIQKFYIKMVNSFAVGPWVFGPASVTVAGNVPVVQMQGLATGDINASFVPGAKAAGMVAFFDGEERQIPANRRVEIPVYAAQSMDLGAISLVIHYPASRLQIEEVTTTYPAENLLWSARDGKLTITWFNLNGIAAPQGSEIITIHARATAGTETIHFSTGPGEMATATGLVIENAAISMPKLVTTASAGSLALQAWPNPSQGVSQFTYAVEEAGNVKLEVFNNLGERVALLTEGQHDAGVYQVRFDGSHLPAGIYITRLDVNGQRTSVRLVITD